MFISQTVSVGEAEVITWPSLLSVILFQIHIYICIYILYSVYILFQI